MKFKGGIDIYENKNLSDIFYAIGDFVKEYELKEKNKQLKVSSDDDNLYKLKEILELYPLLTTYFVNKAVKEKRLTAIQLGKTRYYKKKDIENFLNSNKQNAFNFRRH